MSASPMTSSNPSAPLFPTASGRWKSSSENRLRRLARSCTSVARQSPPSGSAARPLSNAWRLMSVSLSIADEVSLAAVWGTSPGQVAAKFGVHCLARASARLGIGLRLALACVRGREPLNSREARATCRNRLDLLKDRLPCLGRSLCRFGCLASPPPPGAFASASAWALGLIGCARHVHSMPRGRRCASHRDPRHDRCLGHSTKQFSRLGVIRLGFQRLL